MQITSGDFEKLIVGAPRHAFIYADPPYYKAGPQLYKFHMSDDDHRRLAESLRGCRAQWTLSYDDHEFIRKLYDWADISSVALTYTTAIASSRRRKNSELIIAPKREQRDRGAA
jgi:DNA adenine methylase